MANTIVKAPIGAEDVKFKDSGTTRQTFTRADSSSRILTLSKIDGGDIQFRTLAKTLDDLVDGGYDVTLKTLDIITKKPWVDNRFYADLDAAISDIGATEIDVYISTAWTVTANAVVPATMRLVFLQGGSLSNGSNTVTINNMQAGDHMKIFDGAGAITFGIGAVRASNPNWWGAVADYEESGGTGTDNVAAVDAATAALGVTGGVVRFMDGKYKMASKWAIPTNVRIDIIGSALGNIEGAPPAANQGGVELWFVQTDGTNGIEADNSAGSSLGWITARAISLHGNGSAGNGIDLDTMRQMVYLFRVSVEEFGGIGLKMDFCHTSLIQQCSVVKNDTGGMLIGSGVGGGGQSATTLIQNMVESNGNYQAKLNGEFGGIEIAGGSLSPNAVDAAALILQNVTGADISGLFVEQTGAALDTAIDLIQIVGGSAEANWVSGVDLKGCVISRSGQTAGAGRLIKVQNARAVDISKNTLAPGSTIKNPFSINNENVSGLNLSPNHVLDVSQVPTLKLQADPLTGDVDIYAADGNVFYLDPGGADRSVNLPPPTSPTVEIFPPGHTITFFNAATVGSSEYLIIKDNTAAFAYVAPGEFVRVIYGSGLAGSRSWSVLNQDIGLRSKTTTISSAELLALAATPIEVIPDPGNTRMIEFISATLFYDYGGTAYTLNGDYDIAFRYTDGTGTIISQTVDTTGFIDQANDEIRICKALVALQDTDIVVSEPVVIDNIGGGEWTLGDGVLKVKVVWREYETGLI